MSAYFSQGQVQHINGSSSVYALTSQDGHEQERHFCAQCGTTLFWYVSALPNKIGIAGGCFGEEFPVEPTYSVWHTKCVDWLELPSEWVRRDER